MSPETTRDPKSWQVTRLSAALLDEFRRIHCDANDAGWCRCVAWWVETWEGWGERSAEDNARLRDELFERGEYDGYLLRVDGEPVGWCQVGPRDRLKKLVGQFGLAPDPGSWALTCFVVVPAWRGRGVAKRLLAEVLADLPRRGARRVEAFPKRGAELDVLELWNGPEAMFRAAGFEVAQEDDVRPVLARELSPR